LACATPLIGVVRRSAVAVSRSVFSMYSPMMAQFLVYVRANFLRRDCHAPALRGHATVVLAWLLCPFVNVKLAPNLHPACGQLSGSPMPRGR
jgi:hypothetical protein